MAIRSAACFTPVILIALFIFVSPGHLVRLSVQVWAAGEDAQPAFSEDDSARIDELSALVRAARIEGMYGDAVHPAEEILSIRQRVQGPAHWETRRAERRLLYLRYAASLPRRLQDELAEAYAVSRERRAQHIWRDSAHLDRERTAFEAYRRILGPDHHLTLHAQSDLGNTLWFYGRMAEAEQCLREARDGLRRVTGDDPHIQWIGTRLIALYRDMGKLAEAEHIGRECVESSRQLLGSEHWKTHYMMAYLGLVLMDRGRLAEAEALFLDEFECFRRIQAAGGEATGGRSTMNYYMHFALFDLCELFFHQGRLAEAESLLKEGRREFIRTVGREDLYAYYYSYYLARLTADLGRPDEAESLYREALAGIEDLLGADNQKTLRIAGGLAELLLHRGRYAEAEPLLLETRDLYDASPMKGGAEALLALARLGRLRLGQGRLADAEALYRKALNGQRQILGPQHPGVVRSLDALALIQALRGRRAAAEALWREAADGFDAARLRVSLGGLDRVPFTARQSPVPALAACLAGSGRPREAWRHFEANVARGLLDTLSARHVRPLTPDERQRETELNSRLNGIDDQMSALHRLADSGIADAAERLLLTREREALRAELAAFEAGISRKYGVAAGEVLGLERIQSCLASDAAIVGWLDVEYGTVGRPVETHWACVVRSTGNPVWVELPGTGDGGAWTAADRELAGRVREVLRTRALRGSHRRRVELCRRLRDQRLKPLEHLLVGIRHLIVLPAGRMAGVPVEILAESFTVSYAPSGTMVAWLDEKGERPETLISENRSASLLALGDPVYRRGGGVGGPPEPAMEEAAFRRLKPSFCPLPQTRQEVKIIGRLFEIVDEKSTRMVLLGSEASEQRLERLASSGELRKFRYLHFSTHAVMDDRMAMRSAMILSQDRLPDSTEQVLRRKEVYDGRLTGEQIVRTWKLNADLVVLSGCETALGVESGGEGYLGFSQALFVAGARSLLLSLWPVDDRATRLLMSRFYENCLGAFGETRYSGTRAYDSGLLMPRAEALHEAKSWLRGLTAQELHHIHQLESGVDKAVPAATPPSCPYSDPHYWAAFILLGDPG